MSDGVERALGLIRLVARFVPALQPYIVPLELAARVGPDVIALAGKSGAIYAAVTEAAPDAIPLVKKIAKEFASAFPQNDPTPEAKEIAAKIVFAPERLTDEDMDVLRDPAKGMIW